MQALVCLLILLPLAYLSALAGDTGYRLWMVGDGPGGAWLWWGVMLSGAAAWLDSLVEPVTK